MKQVKAMKATYKFQVEVQLQHDETTVIFYEVFNIYLIYFYFLR